MAQEGTSLSAVANGGSYTGAAVTPTNPFRAASMVVTMSGYAPGSGVGGSTVDVELQVSHDGTSWVPAGIVNYGIGRSWCAADCPGIQLRAVIVNWGANATAGTVSATVCGV